MMGRTPTDQVAAKAHRLQSVGFREIIGVTSRLKTST
jgi:hypothetical protein